MRSADPYYFRMTVNAVPNSESMLTKTGLTLGAVLTPFAEPPLDGDEIPTVRQSRAGIIRCRRCRSYVNPFVQWLDHGRKWRCNLCFMVNDCPEPFRGRVNERGQRLDQDEKTELAFGSVEYVAPKEYMMRAPQPPLYVFLLDVSTTSVNSSIPSIFASTLQASLADICEDERALVAFIAFDSKLHFFGLDPAFSQPQMLVVSELDDIQLPAPASRLLVRAAEARDNIDALLEGLPTMFEDNADSRSALGPALQAAFSLCSHIGGKVVIVQTTRPSVGVGALAPRGDRKVIGKSAESSYLVPADNFYKLLAVDAAPLHVSFDTFLLCQRPSDLATVSAISRHTAGNVYFYPGFHVAKDGQRFSSDLGNNLTRPTGWEAVMRIRCSRGVKITAFHGHYFARSSDLLALPNIDCDKSFAVNIAVEDAIQGATSKFSYACLQAALLYTASNGERRIRVHTVALPIVSDVGALYGAVDGHCMSMLLAKMATLKAETGTLEDARSALLNKTSDMVKAYKEISKSAASGSSLVLPAALRLMPFYTLAMVKSRMFRVEGAGSLDGRAFALTQCRTLPVHLLINTVAPRLFQLQPGDIRAKDALPPNLPLSAASLGSDRVMLLDTVHSAWLWLGRDTPAGVIRAIFDMETLEGVDSSQLRLQPLANPLSAYIFAMIDHIRSQRSSYVALYIVRQGDKYHQAFCSYLIADRSQSVMAYPEYLSSLQKS